ncbi:hypothetical protein JOQ06_017150 [Pogonophryne albipinna]|uniref:Peptidase M60 domain-containing protein n=1 Tax=Pogonophryne albipinna TaxID=1090488 RepID=A0AAD6B1P8_9TELE|nr:hypothetical protein JOQ06_017150 [Pogonophryne albipinna]
MSNQPTQNQNEGAYLSLMKGLKELDLRGLCVPSDLLLIGDHSFPLAMNSQGQTLMAASLYGSGRIVVLGHEGYLTAFPALVENALTWLRGEGSDNLTVGVNNKVKAVADNLSKSSFQVKMVGSLGDSREFGVYVTDAYSMGADIKNLVAFMKAGGGVLIAGQAWHWAANHPKENTLLQFEGNKVSGVAGIYFSKSHGEMEYLPVYPQVPSSWMAVVNGMDFEDDLEFLLTGVSEFDLQGSAVSSEILVHGSLAFPIGTTKDGQTFLAGSYYGQGRVIVVSHEGFLGRQTLAPFWNNAIHWLDEGRQGVVAYSDKHAKEIREFVAEGGGLLIGGHAWNWSRTNPGQNELTHFPGNHILNTMGLSLLRGTIKGGLHKAPEPKQFIKDNYHFRHLLHRFSGHVAHGEKLSKHEEENLKRLGRDCSIFLHMDAKECSSYTQVVSSPTAIVMKSGMPQVCASCPVKTPKDHLLLSLATEIYKVSPNPDALLPYLIKDNPLMPVVYNHKIKTDVDTAAEEWISTGLYLSPGMKTYIAMPEEIVNKGWKLTFLEVIKHIPSRGISAPSSPQHLGGKFQGSSQNKSGGPIEVTVQMAVPAPYYKSGVTTPADWSLLRTAPSPWAELEFENIILTIPSDVVRSLERPDELAKLWDEIMRSIADLAAKPHKFPRKERFVTDVQISHGWMHAGYPIMAQKATAAHLVSTAHIRGKGLWGAIHELGHNQQRGCWEFKPNTTECTCNLWSVYVHEEVFGIERGKAHPAMALKKRNGRAKTYAEGGKKLATWSMWVALETYMQLQDKFGWDAFKKVFAAYFKISSPKDNNGKMNLYAVTFSQTVEMNLSAFFKSWGWPIDAATEEKLSTLPTWSDHPMVQYG